MLDHKGFDLWADGDDKTVGLSEESNTYPFAGYKNVLGTIYSGVRAANARRVLDIGCGTAVLTSRLYAGGLDVTAADFSDRMLEIAREKMPKAHLVCADISQGFPAVLAEEKFDAILSTYALHHLTDEQKAPFLLECLKHLNPGGAMWIGDVMRATRKELDALAESCGESWDADECYFAAEDWINRKDMDASFAPQSVCAGVLTLKNI